MFFFTSFGLWSNVPWPQNFGPMVSGALLGFGVKFQNFRVAGPKLQGKGPNHLWALALVSIVFHHMEVPTNLSSDQKVNFQFYDSFSGCSAPLYGLLVCLKSGHKMTKAFMLLATRQNTAAGKTRTRDQRRLLFGEWNFFSTKKALPAKNFRCSSTRSLGFTHNLHLPSQGSVYLKK